MVKPGRMNAAVRDLQCLFEEGSLAGLSDGQLLDRFIERRDEAIFQAIIYRHASMVWGVCRRVLRDHHDAEDAFQATFLVLARRAAAIVPREKLGNWLYGVAFQTARKAKGLRAKRRRREMQVRNMPELTVVSDNPRDELAEVLDQELSRLPRNFRIPIILCDLEGRSHKEAASELGWPVGTVSSRLARARSMLATRLSRHGVPISVGSLAVFLAHEQVSAGVPTQLIGGTAQAAAVFAAEGTAAGMVSAGVMTLAKEVTKIMLLGNLKIAAATLLVVSAVAGGTGLAVQEPGGNPGPKNELQELIDAKHAELQRLVERQDWQRLVEQKRADQPANGKGASRTANPFEGTPFWSPSPVLPVVETRVGDRSQPGDPLSDLILAHIPSNAEQLARAKEVIEELIKTDEEAKAKSPEELDKLIEKMSWEVRLAEARLKRLKAIRETARRSGHAITEERVGKYTKTTIAPSGPRQ